MEEEVKAEEVSYRDIKKGAKIEENKPAKPKY